MTNFDGITPASQCALNFAYDYRGRRIQKMVFNFTNQGIASAWTNTCTNCYVYDGWNTVAILNSSFNLLNSMMWGTDLSGCMQGAGGVGGLLAENIVSNGVQFVANDANGNVVALASATNGATTANYNYGPFGEVIRATGPMAKANPFRFSTIYQDDESDLLMYLHRPYSASQGRFLARDPLGDQVFFERLVDAHREWTYADLDAISHESLKPCYAFVGNDSVNGVNRFGLDQVKGGGQVTMGPRHHNEVVFYATCPKCTKFVWMELTISMCMLTWSPTV